MKEIFILDACVIIAYLKQEPGFETITNFLDRAYNDEISLYIHKLNLLEVYYGFYRDDGKDQAEAVLVDTLSLPIIVVDDLSDFIFHEAGRLKALYDISFADSIALSLTINMGGSIITADHHEFGILEDKEPIKISWIR